MPCALVVDRGALLMGNAKFHGIDTRMMRPKKTIIHLFKMFLE